MVRAAVQLYSLRDLDEPVPELLQRVAETAFEGVEFAGFGETPPGEVADALADTGLDAAGAHVGVDALESDLDATRSTYREVGCDRLVVPHLPGEAFADEAAVRRTADRLTDLADRLGDEFALCYHNHDHEFADLDGRTAFDALVAATGDRVGFEVDVGWVRAAGHDPVALLDRLAGRAPLVHLKDTAGGRSVELGDGDVDVAACAAAARDADADWLVYEHDDPDDPAASLAHGAETLAALVD
jgi:sugar phosphate isomerase/epimerase